MKKFKKLTKMLSKIRMPTAFTPKTKKRLWMISKMTNFWLITNKTKIKKTSNWLTKYLSHKKNFLKSHRLMAQTSATATSKKMPRQKQKKSKKNKLQKATVMKPIIKLSLMLMTTKIMKMKIRIWMSMRMKTSKLNLLCNQYKSLIEMKPKKLMKNLLMMTKTTMSLLLMITKKKMIKFFNLRITLWLLKMLMRSIAQ